METPLKAMDIRPVIVINNLHKEFAGGAKALAGVDFTVARGEFTVILGPSGAGKSTLLRCINGLVRATHGEVLVDGIPVNTARSAPVRRAPSGCGALPGAPGVPRAQRQADSLPCPADIPPRPVDTAPRLEGNQHPGGCPPLSARVPSSPEGRPAPAIAGAGGTGAAPGRTPGLREVRKKVGMIFQQFNLVKRLTVLENVLCGRLAHCNTLCSCLKLFAPSDIEFAMECLKRVGLEAKAYQRADQLSGGQQQRAGIARALAQCPDVLLADEPVASLDPRSAERVMEILCQINARDGITVLVSLHNVDLARSYGERALGLNSGRLVLDKPVVKLTASDVELIYGSAGDEDDGMMQTGQTGQVRWAHA